MRPRAVERVVFFPAFRIGEDVVRVCDLSCGNAESAPPPSAIGVSLCSSEVDAPPGTFPSLRASAVVSSWTVSGPDGS